MHVNVRYNRCACTERTSKRPLLLLLWKLVSCFLFVFHTDTKLELLTQTWVSGRVKIHTERDTERTVVGGTCSVVFHQNLLHCEGVVTWRMIKVEDPFSLHALNAMNRSVMGWQLSFMSVQLSQSDLMSRFYGFGPHLRSSLLLPARRCDLLLLDTITGLKAVAPASQSEWFESVTSGIKVMMTR